MRNFFRVLYDPEAPPAPGSGGAPPTPPPAPGGGNGGGGGSGGGNDWRASLPEAIRADASLADVPDVGTLAQRFLDTKKMVGADKIVKPGEKADTPTWMKTFDELGRPKTAAEYKLPDQGLPEGYKFADQTAATLRQVAHDSGLTPVQTALLARNWAKLEVQGQQQAKTAIETARVECEKTLREKFGGAFDERIKLAIGTGKKVFGDEFMKMVDETGLGNDPRLIAGLAEMGAKIANDDIEGEGSGRSFTFTPEEAQAKIKSLQADPAWVAAYNKGDKAKVEEMAKLYEAAYPNAEAPDETPRQG